MKRTQIYLKPSQFEHLKEYAERRGISISKAIRQVVEKYFNSKIQNASVLNDILEISKNNQAKGPKDLAENHDKYIYHND